MLTLDENLALLALDDHTGETLPMPAQALELGLAAAVLLELTLQRYVRLEGQQVEVLSRPQPPEDAFLQHAWRVLLEVQEPGVLIGLEAALQSLLPPDARLLDMVGEKLVRRNILRHDTQQRWWLLTTHAYPMLQEKEERITREALRTLVLSQAGEAPWDERLAMLLGLVVACRLEQEIFTPQEWESAASRVAAILQAVPCGCGLQRAVDRVQLMIAQAISLSGM